MSAPRFGPLVASALALATALAACNESKPRVRRGPARGAPTARAAPTASAPPPASAAPDPSAPVAAASASGSGAPASSPPASSAVAPAASVRDVCRVTRGPIQLSFTGPVMLRPGGPNGDPRIVFNRDGVPHAVTLPKGTKPPDRGKPDAGRAPERLALTEQPERAVSPACAEAGPYVFCVDRGGSIHRSAPSGEGGSVVAVARPGSPLAAAPLGGGHVVYAFLADRKTTEGATTLAFAGLDDAIPMLLSEDGSGATFVTLASRGDDAVAMYVDARRVLTPVHARVLSYAEGKLMLGQDAVVFVGSGTDGRTGAALARGASGHELALLPMDKDDKAFGMAAIRIEEQPRDDAATAWSLYPGAMDRAAIACTQGTSPIHVLRTRPADDKPKAKTVLELGQLDAAGGFEALCTVAEAKSITDPAILDDRAGGLWLAYTDGDGTWIERRGR